MPLDISLILRKWDFDLNSEALGPIRIANADMKKIFDENEAPIRTGELAGAQLARMLFEKMAHKRTGDEAVDKLCEGPTFDSSELDLLTSSELDLFADTLIKGRLRFVIPKNVAAPKRTATTGCAALSGALIAFADAARASRAALAETWRKQFSAVDQIEAQMKQTQSIAAALGLTSSIVEDERIRAEKWASMASGESIADKAMRDWKRQDDQVRTAIGYLGDGVFAKSISQFKLDEKLAATAGGYASAATALGCVNDGGIAKVMEQYKRDQKIVATAMGTGRPDMLGFAGMTAAERIGMASGLLEYPREHDLATKVSGWEIEAVPERDTALREFRPLPVFHPSPNPVHETNKIVGELLGHQKEEAAKKEAESVTANATTKSGLLYTKLSFWVTLVAFVVPSICGTWVYFEQKAAAEAAKVESAESAKAAAAESAKQRADITELTDALRKSIELKPRADQGVKALRDK